MKKPPDSLICKETICAINFKRIFFLYLIIIVIGIDFSGERIRDFDSTLRSMVLVQKIQSQYSQKNNGEFASSFEELIKHARLDSQFSGEKPIIQRYIFTMKYRRSSSNKPAFYSLNADPLKSDNYIESVTATHFYLDSNTWEIKMTEENRPANADDSSINKNFPL